MPRGHLRPDGHRVPQCVHLGGDQSGPLHCHHLPAEAEDDQEAVYLGDSPHLAALAVRVLARGGAVTRGAQAGFPGCGAGLLRGDVAHLLPEIHLQHAHHGAPVHLSSRGTTVHLHQDRLCHLGQEDTR